MSNEELQQLQPLDLTKEHYPLDIKLCSEELPTDFREYVLVYVPSNRYWTIAHLLNNNNKGHNGWIGMFTECLYDLEEISMWAKLPIVENNGVIKCMKKFLGDKK